MFAIYVFVFSVSDYTWLLTSDKGFSTSYDKQKHTSLSSYLYFVKFNMHPNVSDWPPHHLMLEGRFLLDNPVLSFQLWLDSFCSNDRTHSYSPSETLMAELDPIVMVKTAAGETMENTSEHLLLVLSFNNDISPEPIIGGAP